jgi:uncharacterized membrane protein
MTTSTPGVNERVVFLLLAISLGVPTLVTGGLLSYMGVIMGLSVLARGDIGTALLVFGLGASGFAGLVGFVRLSLAFVSRGAAGGRQCPPAWWVGLLLGSLAALLMLAVLVSEWRREDAPWPMLLGGPLLLPLSAWFLRMRFAASPHVSAP